MKRRRLAIVAFLLSAILVMGIGYAAVSGTLNITGTAYFHGTGTSGTAINAAVKFKDEIAVSNSEMVSASITDTTNYLAADMNVTFNDAVGTPGTPFSAYATFTIVYEGEANNNMLKDVKFDTPNPTIPSAQNSPGFSIAAEFVEADSQSGTVNDDGTCVLKAGETIKVTVTVTYTNQDPVETGTVSAAIRCPLVYNVVTND